MKVDIDKLMKLAEAGVTADRLNALVDAELKNEPAPDPEPKPDPEPDPEPEPEPKADPEPEPEPDEKDKKIIDLEAKIKKMQEENRRAGSGLDATKQLESDRQDLIKKISSNL